MRNVDKTTPQLCKTVATIASGQSLSGAVHLAGTSPLRLVMPAAWTAAVLTFQVGDGAGGFSDLYDSFGGEYTVQAAASRSIVLDPADFAGVEEIKIRSGAAGSAVNQDAARSITIVSGPTF